LSVKHVYIELLITLPLFATDSFVCKYFVVIFKQNCESINNNDIHTVLFVCIFRWHLCPLGRVLLFNYYSMYMYCTTCGHLSL